MAVNIRGIKERAKQLIAHKFVRNTAILQIGNVGGNLFQAVVGIIMARILEPARYGVYGLAFSLAGLISIFLAVGAQDAVTTILGGAYAKRDHNQIREALAFLAKMAVITGAVAFAGALIAPLLAKLLYHDYHIGIYAGIVIFASIISTTAFSLSMIVLQVSGRIKGMTILGLSDQVLRTALALLAVVLGYGVQGIAFGHFIGAFIIFIAASFLWRSVQRQFPIFPSIRELLAHISHVSIKKYLGFSLWIALDRNLSNLYNILPVLLTGIYVTTSEVTFFKIAFAYINLGLSFLGPIGTLLNVEFPRMKADNMERLAKNFVRISLYSLAISTAITLLAALVAPIAFWITYGAKYMPSVKYVYGLIPYGATLGIGIGLGSILRALNKVKFSIAVNSLNLSFGALLGLFLIRHFGAWGTITLVTVWYLFAHLTVFSFVLRYLKRQTHDNVYISTGS